MRAALPDSGRPLFSPVRVFAGLVPFAADPHACDPLPELRLALSENHSGPSPAATVAAAQELQRLHLYPDSGAEPLRGALAAHYGVDPEQVLVGNGSDEVLLLAALAVRPGPAVVCQQTFAGHAAAVEAARLMVSPVPLRGGRVDVPAVLGAMRGASIAVVANPHNPGGGTLDERAVGQLVDAARAHQCLLVLDEAYAEFAYPEVFTSGLPYVPGGGVVVVRSFSKAYGLAGLRVGYAVGDPQAVGAMHALRTGLPYNVSRPALAAAVAALADQDHLARVVEASRDAREKLTRILRAHRVPVTTSQTNFVLADLGPGAQAFAGRVAAEGITVRLMDGLGWSGWVRISMPPADRLPVVTAAIAEACEQEGLR